MEISEIINNEKLWLNSYILNYMFYPGKIITCIPIMWVKMNFISLSTIYKYTETKQWSSMPQFNHKQNENENKQTQMQKTQMTVQFKKKYTLCNVQYASG